MIWLCVFMYVMIRAAMCFPALVFCDKPVDRNLISLSLLPVFQWEYSILVFSLFACSFAFAVISPLLFSLKIAMDPVAEQQRPQLFYPVIRNPKLGICAFLFSKHFLPSFCPILANDLSNRPDQAALHTFIQCCSWVLMLGLINISRLSVNESIKSRPTWNLFSHVLCWLWGKIHVCIFL